MFRNILVPVDLSEHNERVVKTAAELAEVGEAQVRLLHVIETIEGVPFEELEDFYAGLRRKAEKAIDEWAELLSQAGRVVYREIVIGHRAREILRYASESDCDLIVVGSHQLDPDRPGGGLGTISHQIAVVAPCAVLVLR